MTYIPGFGTGPVPASPSYVGGAPAILDSSEDPVVYTSTGPLKAQNGLAFTPDGFVFDPGSVEQGNLDCGTFGS